MPNICIYFFGLIVVAALTPNLIFAQPAGCPSGFIGGNQTVNCSTASTSGSPQSSSEAISTPINVSGATNNNNNVTVTQYTTIQLSGSPVGLASGNTVSNYGTLNSNSFTNGYGISFGANGRSRTGGNTVLNGTTGQIITAGSNANGIYVNETLAGSSGNSITNAGSVLTSGNSAAAISLKSGSTGTSIVNSIVNTGTLSTSGSASAYGIEFNSVAGTNTVNNSGTISASGNAANAISITSTRNTVDITNSGTIAASGAGANGINVSGAASITNSGTIRSTSGFAINFEGILPTGAFNTLNINSGSVINGGINFNVASVAETLTFNSYTSSGFNNAISGLNVINVTNSSNVAMNSAAGYELVSGQVNVDGSSSLNINAVVKDQVLPSTASSITKTGTGTLTLSGANTYSGGTTVSAGTLAGNTTSLQGNITNNATVDFNQASAGTYAGTMSGTGTLTKTGTGTLTLSGANTYSGGTSIEAGNLILTGSVASSVSVASGAILQGGGKITGNLTNAGTVAPSFAGTQTNLTINGNFAGAGGNFVSNVYAPAVSPVADTMVVTGNTTGSTGVTIVDKGGLGNRTSGNGIEVVSVGGTSATNAFALNRRVAAGAFEYKLVKGPVSGAGNSWYLRTDNPATPDEPVVIVPLTPAVGERIEVSVYPALPSLIQLYAQTAVDTLDQRRGDLNLVDPQGVAKKASSDWARIIGKTGSSTPSSASNGPNLNFNAYAFQFGVDLYQDAQQGGSRTYIGPYATIGGANGNTSNQGGTTNTGNINGLQAYSAGLYATHFAENGLYVDALAQGSRYLNANVSSVQGAQLKTQGSGFTGSLEAGGRWNMTDKFLISPQAQVVYDVIGMSNAADAYGQISFGKSEMSRGRLGLLAGHKDVVGGTPVFAYLRASYWNVFNPGASTSFQSLYGVNSVSFQSQTASRWMTVDAEINAKLTNNTNLFLNLAVENSLMGTYQAYSGRVGVQTRF